MIAQLGWPPSSLSPYFTIANTITSRAAQYPPAPGRAPRILSRTAEADFFFLVHTLKSERLLPMIDESETVKKKESNRYVGKRLLL